MITSKDNSRVKDARKLHERRHRLERRQLLIEGVRLVADAWRSGVRPELVFYDGQDAARGTAQEWVEMLDGSGVECLACSTAVFASLSDTITPQGIAAVVPLVEIAPPAQPTLALVLDRLADPGNAGTLLRTAEAAGVEIVIFGPQTVDPYNDKVVRAGMGAHFRLPLRTCADWQSVQDSLPATIPFYLAEAQGSMVYDAVDWRQPSALIVGGEAEGASPQARSRARSITIPMIGQVESLNAAMAGAVILFEAARQRRGGGAPY